MENRKMEAIVTKVQEEQKEEDFGKSLQRLQQLRNNGCEVEAATIQTDILLKHGTWIR